MCGNPLVVLGSYDPSSAVFREYPNAAPGFAPHWLAVAPDGRIWFTSISEGGLGVLTPADGQIDLVPVPGGPDTTGIDVGADGTIWFGTAAGQLGPLVPATGAPRWDPHRKRSALPAHRLMALPRAYILRNRLSVL